MPRKTRRAFLLLPLLGPMLAWSPAAASPVGVKLQKSKVGQNYRVTIRVTVKSGVVNVTDRYVGHLDVPPSGTVVRKFDTTMSGLAFELQVAATRLNQAGEIRANIRAKLQGATIAILTKTV